MKSAKFEIYTCLFIYLNVLGVRQKRNGLVHVLYAVRVHPSLCKYIEKVEKFVVNIFCFAIVALQMCAKHSSKFWSGNPKFDPETSWYV